MATMQSACAQSAASPRLLVWTRAGKLLGATLWLLGAPITAQAQDATWNTAPGSADWNTGTNWTPNLVPAGTATFGTSSTTTLTFTNSSSNSIGTLQFNVGASAYTFDLILAQTLNVTGSGIVNNAAVQPTFFGIGIGGVVNFQSASTAANASFVLLGSTVNFNNSSNAGTATITMPNNMHPGAITFNSMSSAENANITVVQSTGAGLGTLDFFNSSTAGNATIANNQGLCAGGVSCGGVTTFHDTSTAGNAAISTQGGGSMSFTDTATAGSAVITNNSGGNTNILSASTAGSATIVNNNGGVLNFGITTILGIFGTDTSTAGSATITNNSGGSTFFNANTTGGTARMINNAGGIMDISGLAASFLTIGSIEGAGSFQLGSKTLAVGGNNLSTTVSGVIADGGYNGGAGGALEKTGTGTLTLSGANTYTGGTTLIAGTLIVGNSAALGTGPLALGSGTTLSFAQSGITLANATTTNVVDPTIDTGPYTDTLSGVISGTGGLTKQGTGTLILDGASTNFTGGTTVAAGTLEVGDATNPGATLAGNVTVNSGATLRGHGTISGSVTNGGMLQPGGSIGILTVAGNYTQTSAGTLIIEVTPNVAAGPGVGYDQLRVGGTATLAGALSIIDDPGTYTVGSRYTIVTASGGRSGTFATVAYNPLFAAYLTPDLSYDASNVYLTLDPTPALSASAQQVPDALTAMVSAAEGVGDVVLGDVCSVAAQRLVTQGQGCVVHPVGDGLSAEIWMRGLGGLGSVAGTGARSSYHDDYGGTLLGAGIGRGGFTIGAGAGYLATGLNFSDGSSASQNAGLGFVYGRYVQGSMWLGAMAAYGGGQINGSRALPGTGLAAAGSRGADFAVIQTRAAYDLPLGAVTLEPRATLAYIHAGQASFTETGASLLDLTYAATHADVTEGRLAVRVMQSFSVGNWSLLPWVEAGVQQVLSGLSRTVTASDGTFSASVAGVSPAPTAATAGIGLTASATPAIDVFVTYQGQFSANQIENAFSAGLLYRF